MTPHDPHDARDPHDVGHNNPARSASTGALPAVFRTALRRSAILALALTVLACAVGFLVAGMPGLLGALVGAGLAAAFLLTTVVVMLGTANKPQTVVTGALAGTWLVKVILVIVVLAVLQGMNFYEPRVLALTLIVLTLGMLGVEMATVMKARIPLDVAPRDEGGRDTGGGPRP